MAAPKKQSDKLHVFLLSSGQSFSSKKAVGKCQIGKGTTCNLEALQDDIYNMSKYFYSIGAKVYVHHNNKPKKEEVLGWLKAFYEESKNNPKVVYYTGHGDGTMPSCYNSEYASAYGTGNWCVADGEITREDVLEANRSQRIMDTMFIMDCCFSGQWGYGSNASWGYYDDGGYLRADDLRRYNRIRKELVCAHERQNWVFASSHGNEKSQTQNKGSVYTNYLLRVMPKGNKYGNDGYEFFRYMVGKRRKLFEKK
eukprot:86328_1